MRTRLMLLAFVLCLGAVEGCHKKGGGGYLQPAAAPSPAHVR